MGKRQVCLFPLTAVMVVVACGGRVVEDDTEIAPPAGFWPAEAERGTVDAFLGQVLDVPGGSVRVGYWPYDLVGKRFVPGACDDKADFRSVSLRVSSFRLTRLEVSGAVYARCVEEGRCRAPEVDLSEDPTDAGAWNDPRRAAKAAGVTYAGARTFCRAYGGDLPTYTQWIRAAEGDSGGYGIRHLTETYIRCVYGYSDPLCVSLLGTDARPWPPPIPMEPVSGPPLPDVGSNAWDVGPYGHADLFGSAAEWIRLWGHGPEMTCEGEGRPADPLFVPTWEPGPQQPTTLMHIGFELYGSGVRAASFGADAPVWAYYNLVRKAGAGSYFTGFRCAFPPAEGE